jgi:hypothetical protein
MKFTSTYKLLVCAAFLMALISCDKVEKPVEYGSCPPNSGLPVESDPNGISQKKVLLEDYTGHKCGNCPKALDTINSIVAAYGESVIPVSIHSGYYSTLSGPNYLYNWVVESPTKPGYNELDDFFQVSANGNPNGMINRKYYNTSSFTHIMGIDVWKTEVNNALSSPLEATIKITNRYDTTSKQISSSITVRFLASLTGKYRLATMLIEDSIVKPQKDYRFNPDDILNYTHRHALRGYLYSAFGEEISEDPFPNQKITKDYCISISGKSYDSRHCYVIAYVYNSATYEIIQAEELRIRN